MNQPLVGSGGGGSRFHSLKILEKVDEFGRFIALISYCCRGPKPFSLFV